MKIEIPTKSSIRLLIMDENYALKKQITKLEQRLISLEKKFNDNICTLKEIRK